MVQTVETGVAVSTGQKIDILRIGRGHRDRQPVDRSGTGRTGDAGKADPVIRRAQERRAGGIDDRRIIRLEFDIFKIAATAIAPVLTGIGAAIDPVAGGGQQDVGIIRMDQQFADAAGLGYFPIEAGFIPGGASVGRFQHPDAVGIAGIAVAGGDVDRRGITGIDRHAGNPQHRQLVGRCLPTAAAVGGDPQPTGRGADIDDVAVERIYRRTIDPPDAGIVAATAVLPG